MSSISMALVDSLLCLQNRANISGNILEMGVYRGRSAALLGRRLKGDERLTLVDIGDFLDPNAIQPFLILVSNRNYIQCLMEPDNYR